MAESGTVFDYLDYRAFLRAYYARKKSESDGRFSYRAFSRRAGLKSPNYLKLVIDGDRNLSATMAVTFGQACGLVGEQLEYFRVLVALNQADDAKQRDALQKQIERFRRFRTVHAIERDRVALHSAWYVPVIHELVACEGFREDPRWIASMLVPRITPSQARRAIEVLTRLDMVTRDENGKLVVNAALLSTPAQVPAPIVRKYHQTMIKLAGESIERVPRERRDISSLTLAIGEGKREQLIELVRKFRRDLLHLSNDGSVPVEVVQLNMQLFPLTETVSRKSK